MKKSKSKSDLSVSDTSAADNRTIDLSPVSIPDTEHSRQRVCPNAAEARQAKNVSRGNLRNRLASRWAESVLAAIVISCVMLSLWWVFRVPILQTPDENSHLDYAFSIYSSGRLLNVRTAPSNWNTHSRVTGAPHERISHLYTLYLIDAVDFQRLKYHPEQKVPYGYGTTAYYQNLDLNAPHTPANQPDLSPSDNPWLLRGYPFGYYALVAAWLKLLSVFSNSLVVLFFGARIFSVILLAASLALSYATARELRLSKGRALTLTAIVGFLPLTSFVSSAVQPDNLTLTLVLLCFYCGLLLRRSELNDMLILATLGMALGALIVTKYQFFFFTSLCILGMLVSEHVFQRRPLKALLRNLGILVVPPVSFFAIQVWVAWGNRVPWNLRPAMKGPVEGVKDALADYYGGGAAFISWWGQFGWTDTQLIIGSFDTQRRLTLVMISLTVAILGLTLIRLEQVITRLVILARTGRWRLALRIALSNPLINSHFLFTIFMVLLYALSGNSFFAQGRHWFPYILSGFLITTQYAPRALTHRKTQAAVSALLFLGLVVYCAIGSYYSIETIKKRYYAPQTLTKVTGG